MNVKNGDEARAKWRLAIAIVIFFVLGEGMEERRGVLFYKRE